MEKHYMVAKPAFMATLLALVLSFNVGKAQNCPPNNTMAEFQNFTYTPAVSWNSSAYLSLQYHKPDNILPAAADHMRFRMLVPNGFNRCASDGLKYPLIVFLHGSGESGPEDETPNDGVGEQNNDLQLVHGGTRHRDAVANNSFPGFVIFPQIRRSGSDNYWGPGNLEAVRYIIDKLVADYKVDPDRIYVHGLSMGGEGTWQFISRYPHYFAAAHPMSAAGSNFTNGSTADVQRYKHIPLRLSQGALDTNPAPVSGNNQVTIIRGEGGRIEYAYYPTLGHGTWGDEYNKSDFFSWFLARRKNMIAPLYEQTSFCPELPISASNPVVLGLSPGFASYQWASGTTSNIISSGTNANQYTATAPGTYFARYQRLNGTWGDWSPALVLDNNKAPSATPSITTNNQSVNLPPLDGRPNVTLIGTAAKASYLWKNGVATLPQTTQTLTVDVAGSYTVQTKDPGGATEDAYGAPTKFRPALPGCLSAASSPVVVTTSNGIGAPAVPGNFFASANSSTSISLSWDDRSANELGFEIYRTLTPGSSYELISIRPATSGPNPQTYVDNTNIQANKIYYYRMRAVNQFGGSAYTTEISATTTTDNIPPTAPVLTLVSTTRSEINLSWAATPGTDNVGIFEYDVYQNGLMIATLPAATKTFKATGLVALASYNYIVKARDFSGNTSPASNQVLASAANTGLFYTYYHHANLTTTAQIATQEVIKTGTVANFSLSPRTRNDGFAFIYEGFINIPTTGSYTFYPSSDDGSQVYVNNVLVANHDGAHGCTEKAGTPINLSAGTYPIRVLMFENSGGECLSVLWQGPGISKAAIPDAALRDNVTLPTALSAPSNFRATATNPTATTITLNWTDNSNNETGFEISQTSASNGNGTYVVIGITAPNANSFVNTGLSPSTRYYYKIRAINSTTGAASSLVGPVNNQTASCNGCTPPVPTGLAGVAASATQVNLTWNDNSTIETGFELQKSTSSTTGFVSFATVGAGVTSVSDNQASGHATIYYRIRALGQAGTASSYSSAVAVVTPNRIPVIQNVANQTLTANLATPQTITITVTDPDNDPIVFNVTGLPAGATFESNGYGKGVFTFTNFPTSPPAYNINVQATDGVTNVSDDFTVTFTTNRNPVVTPQAGFNGTLATEEGRTVPLVLTINDPDNTPLTITPTVTGLPGFATTSWGGNNTQATRTFTINFTPAVGQAGVYENIIVRATDSQGGVTEYPFSVIVAPVDRYFTISVNFASGVTLADYNYLDFYEGAPWNNTGSPSTTDLANLKDEQGSIVKFLTFNTGTGWTDSKPLAYNHQLNTPFPTTTSPIYTKKVRESFFKRSNASATTARFKNLNPALQYRVTIFGSGPLAGSTRYVVTGTGAASSLILATQNNPNQTVRSEFAFPTAAGELTIAVSRAVSGSGTYYINAMILEAQYPAPEPPTAPSGLTLTSPVHNRVDVSWTDNSFNETHFNVLRSLTAEGPYAQVNTTPLPANQTTFTDNTVSGRTPYYYKVEAANNYGSNQSNALVITTPNGIPTLTPPETMTVRVGQILQYNISAADPEGDPLTFTTLNLPAFATLVDNGGGTGFIRIMPQPSDIGTFNFTLKVTDNFSASTENGATIIVLDAEVDEAVFINFKSSANPSTPSLWNNKNDTDNNSTLINSSGQPSSIQITKSPTFTGSAASGVNSGINTGNNSGIFPDIVTQSYWTTTGTGTIYLTGLDPAKRYNLTMFGSKNEFWFVNSTYTITSPTPTVAKTLNATMNRDKTVRFVGIKPAAGGVITFTVTKDVDPGTGVANRNAVINALVIEGYDESTTPRKPTNLKAQGISRTAIRLNWEDNSYNETGGFQIWRSETQEGPFTLRATVGENIETFDDTGLPSNKAYIYRVRAIQTGAINPSGFTTDAMATTYSQVILVNPRLTEHSTAPAPWNNLPSPAPGITVSNLKNDLNANTTVDFTITQQGLGSGNNSGYFPGAYPDVVMQTFYFYERYDVPSRYYLAELNQNMRYDMAFLGSEWSIAIAAGLPVATDFTVGAETITQFNGKNASEIALFKEVRPEQDNTISFEVKANDGANYGVWNALEIRAYTPISAVFDTEPPSIPNGLVASEITDISFTLAWNPSTDNIGVANYEIFLGSNLVATVTDTTAVLTNLQPLTTYSVSVRAVDVKGNRSGFSDALQVTTLVSSTEPVNYYPKPSGDISVLATWGKNANGSGAVPTSFTANYQHFNLTRNASISAPLTISGTDARLIVGQNIQLTINDAVTGTIDANDNATVVINTTFAPSFGVLSPSSTVQFTGSLNNIPGGNYGNITLTGANSFKVFNTGSYTVTGNVDIADGVNLNGATGNSTILNIGGNLSLLGKTTETENDQLLSLRFTSGATQTLTTNQSNIRLFRLHVAENTRVNITNPTPLTLTLEPAAASGGVVLDSGAVLNVGKHTLKLEGTAAINTDNNGMGKLAFSKGNLVVNSTSQVSNLYFATGADTLTHVSLNTAGGQVHVRSKMNVRGKLDIANGAINSNGNVVLLSDANGSAWIGPIRNAGALNGAIEFQRYFSPNGRVYRYVSAPVVGSSVANWSSYLPVTGPFTGSTNRNTTHSLYYYDNDAGWVGYPSETSQEPLEVGRGYSIFVFSGATARKLRINGPIRQGQFEFSNLGDDNSPESSEDDVEAGNGWNLLGNPYASPIQWGNSGWTSSGLNGSVYVRRNEVINGVSETTALYHNGEVGTFDGIIAQGQSFWVKAIGEGSPSLTITEEAKYDASSVILQRTTSPSNLIEITLTRGNLTDQAIIHFRATSSDKVDAFDALKLPNSYFNLSSRAGETNLAINTLPLEYCSKTVPLTLTNTAAGQYTLSFGKLETFDQSTVITLTDAFTGSSTVLGQDATVSFEVNAEPASFAQNRFSLTFGKPALDETVAFTTSAATLCGDGDIQISLANTQPDVSYALVLGSTKLGHARGNGGTVSFTLEQSNLPAGTTTGQLMLMASFDGCTPAVLPSTVTMTRTVKPAIKVAEDALESNGTGTFQWYLDGQEIPGATEKTYRPEYSGEYAVRVANGICELTSDPVLFAVTSIEHSESGLKFYPNPTKKDLHILLGERVSSSQTIEVEIVNTQGIVVQKSYIQNRKGDVVLNVGNLASGLYLIILRTDNQIIEERFIKE